MEASTMLTTLPVDTKDALASAGKLSMEKGNPSRPFQPLKSYSYAHVLSHNHLYQSICSQVPHEEETQADER